MGELQGSWGGYRAVWAAEVPRWPPSLGGDPVGVGVRTQILKAPHSIRAAVWLWAADPGVSLGPPHSSSQGDLLKFPAWLVAGERCAAQ